MTSTQQREAWNKGKLVGQKPPLKPKDIWAIRIHLQQRHAVRDLAMFNLIARGFLETLSSQWRWKRGIDDSGQPSGCVRTRPLCRPTSPVEKRLTGTLDQVNRSHCGACNPIGFGPEAVI